MGNAWNRNRSFLDMGTAMRDLILDFIGAFMLVFGGALMIGAFSCIGG